MNLAETAQLAVQLNLTGNFNSGLQTAERELGAFNQSATTRSGMMVGAFDKVKGAASGMGGALSHAGGQLKNLISGPLGMIGLGAGLFSLGGVLERAISRAQDFGGEVRRLAALTGLSVEKTSAMAAGLEHFGIGAEAATKLVGFLEKNVGNLTVTSATGAKTIAEWNKHHSTSITVAQKLALEYPKLIKFERDYGIVLTDRNGKVKDANELLLTTADYFNNKAIPATEKAAGLAKLYGRSWQELIPYLKAGRQGIIDAQVEAAKLGLTLSGKNVQDLADLKKATNEWHTALGGLELQIGLQLVPTLTKFAQGLTAFVRDHRQEITTFFGDLATFVGNTAGTIGSAVSSMSKFWNSVPPEFRDLLMKGVGTYSTIKFLFGFDPVKAGVGLLGKGFDLFAARGATPANPMWVQSVGGGIGGAGGGIPGAAGAAGGGGVLAGLASLVGLAAFTAILSQVASNPVIGQVKANAFGVLTPGQTSLQDNMLQRIIAQQRRDNTPANPGLPTIQGPLTERKIYIAANADRLAGILEHNRIAIVTGATQTKNALDTESAAVTRAIHAQTLVANESRKNLQALPENLGKAQRRHFDMLRDKLEGNRIAVQGSARTISSRVDSESAAVTRAIHAQKLAVNLAVSTRVSVTDINNSVRTYSVYSTGMRGAILGM